MMSLKYARNPISTLLPTQFNSFLKVVLIKKKKQALCITHFHKTDHLLSTDFISFYLRKFFVTLSLTENYKWFPAPVDFEQMDDPDARFTILESDIVLKESFICFGWWSLLTILKRSAFIWHNALRNSLEAGFIYIWLLFFSLGNVPN